MKTIKRVGKLFVGDEEKFSLKHRVLNGVLFFMFLIFAGAIFINAAIGESSTVIFLSVIGTLAYGVLYFFSRFKNRFLTPAVLGYGLALFFFSPILWIRDGGLTGGFPFFLIMFGILAAIVFSGKWRAFFLVSEVLVVSLLLLLERIYPKLITHCPGRNCVFYNNLWGFSLSLLVVIIVGLFYIERFEETHRKLREYARKLEELSRRDPLTGLYNRRELMDRLNFLSKIFSRNRSKLALIMIDLDNFKRANDNFGHRFGDKLLREIAEEWSRILREGDILGRWGGDEFLVILPHANAHGAKEVAERLKNKVMEISSKYSPDLKLSLSAGITEVDTADVDLEHFIEEADRALYEGKRRGGGSIVILNDND